MGALSAKAHWPPFYIYLQSAAIALAAWWMTVGFYQDDSYITLVYARNWLEGYGLVWNRGDVPVEGYTNFLFLAAVAVLGWLGMDLVAASHVVSFIAYGGLVLAMVHFAHRFYRLRYADCERSYAHRVNSALCAGLVASAVPILAWCMGGLETVLFTALLSAALCRIVMWLEFGAAKKEIFITGLLFALAAMTRMEAVMVWGLTGLVLGFFWITKVQAERIDFTRLILLGAGFLFLYAPYTAWRISYYGDWLPNTYYAKTYGIPSDFLTSMGWYYLFQCISLPPLLPLVAALLLFIVRRRLAASGSIFYLVVIIAAYLVHIVTSGGDFMKYVRFFVPVIPMLVLVVYLAGCELIELNEKWFRDVSGALLILSIFQFGYVDMDDRLSRGALSGRMMAPYVNAHWPKGSLIAVNPAGALPYFAGEYHYIDMLGLNDRHIARRAFTRDNFVPKPAGHIKGDGAYVLSRKPDYIIFGHAWGSAEPQFTGDREIAASEDFRKHYRMVEVFVTPPADLVPLLEHALQELGEKRKDTFAEYTYFNDKKEIRLVYFERIRH